MRQVSAASHGSEEDLKDVQVLEKALSRRLSKRSSKIKIEKKKGKKVTCFCLD